MGRVYDKGINTPEIDLKLTVKLVEAQDVSLEQAIIQYSIHNGINYETSIRIANCESKMGKYKTNWEGSSAKGIFMFTDGTWNYINAKGSQLDDIENIKQFTIWYKIHPEWWSCK